MSDKNNNSPFTLLPRISIYVLDQEPLKLGGLDKFGSVLEMVFYSKLNSFAFNADVTIEDVDNTALNLLAEPLGVSAILSLFEVPNDIGKPFEQITTNDTKRVFQKTFSVDSIEVLKYSTSYPQKSIIKIHLTDILDSVVLCKLMKYSNFNLKWDSKEMGVDATMHEILKLYEEKSAGKIVIPEDIFGVNPTSLKRRFATDCSTSIRDVFQEYISSLYQNQWIEYLTDAMPDLNIPKVMLAYSNRYTLDGDGILRQRPWLTTSNMLDEKPDDGIYSIPYPKNGKILEYAHKDYNISIEDCDINLKGGSNGEMKEQILALSYKQNTFNPKVGIFLDDLQSLSDMPQLDPKMTPDVESLQNPRYFGIGNDPKFAQINNISQKLLIQNPMNIKETKYYPSDGFAYFYEESAEMLFRPSLYVSIPFSAWHSPGQEVDLRMINSGYFDFKPVKNYFFSMNKLVSGRWKILNSVTTFKQADELSIGLTPTETLGLCRTRYLRGTKPED